EFFIIAWKSVDNESIFPLKRDVNNGVTERANSTKVLCKFNNGKAIKRGSIISTVGESNNEDKNDAAETRVSRKKRRFESAINEFDDSSNIDKNKRSGMEMER
ncbi:7636_t:CDS:2, partial [Entrophospora sp. SA101]